MGKTQASFSSRVLSRLVGTAACPRLVDVRRSEVFEAATDLIPGAVWRDHRDAETWAGELHGSGEIVVYCVHGHQVGLSAAALLREQGFDARYLSGGIEGYRASGGPLIKKSPGLPDGVTDRSQWVAATGIGLDGLARTWFVRRFLDPAAVLHFVEPDWVEEVASELGARPIRSAAPGQGDGCRLHDFFLRYSLRDDALNDLAGLVEKAGRDRDGSGQAGIGLPAMIAGLTEVFEEDAARVSAALPVFDALYVGCRLGTADPAAPEGS
ncbi:MAG: chromate resistance protein [Kiloniellales bacterium]|nr:chromate resistance protein [Kiloniellales bacterium]